VDTITAKNGGEGPTSPRGESGGAGNLQSSRARRVAASPRAMAPGLKGGKYGGTANSAVASELAGGSCVSWDEMRATGWATLEKCAAGDWKSQSGNNSGGGERKRGMRERGRQTANLAQRIAQAKPGTLWPARRRCPGPRHKGRESDRGRVRTNPGLTDMRECPVPQDGRP